MRMLLSCFCVGRRRLKKSRPAAREREDLAPLAAGVSLSADEDSDCRSGKWRPALAAISEDFCATAKNPKSKRNKKKKKIRIKISRKVLPRDWAAERNTWHLKNQMTLSSFGPAFFMF